MRNWKADLRIVKLQNTWALTLTCWNNSSADNLNRRLTCAMKTSHLLVHLMHSPYKRGISVLFTHIVRTGTRMISQSDSIVLNNPCVLLSDLVNTQDLTSRLLHLLVLMQEIPESRLCGYLIWCKDLHTVQLWSWISIRWCLATNYLEMFNSHPP